MSVFKKSLLILGALYLLFSGCTQNKNPKVGLLIHQQDDRWSMDVAYLREYFEVENIELIVKDACGDENLQLKQVKELIDLKVDVVLIAPVNQNTAAGIVRYANQKNIPIISYDRIIKNSNVDYLLSFEYADVGRMLAQYAIEKCPEGNYVLFWGDASDNNAQTMKENQMDILKPYIEKGDINIIFKGYIDDWSLDNSSFMMRKIMDYTDESIDMVIANNDVMAEGVIAVLNEYDEARDIFVTGHDATLGACRLIVQNKQAMTIYKPISKLAMTAVEVSKQIINNKKVETNSVIRNGAYDIPSILLKPLLVDKQNLESVVVADGLHSRNEIYQR